MAPASERATIVIHVSRIADEAGTVMNAALIAAAARAARSTRRNAWESVARGCSQRVAELSRWAAVNEVATVFLSCLVVIAVARSTTECKLLAGTLTGAISRSSAAHKMQCILRFDKGYQATTSRMLCRASG